MQQLHQLLGVADKTRAQQTASRQRPQHPKQQTVNMLVRHRGQHLHIQCRHICAKGRLQRMHLGIQLRQALFNPLRCACRARGEQHHAGLRHVQRLQHYRIHHGGVQRRAYCTGQLAHTGTYLWQQLRQSLWLGITQQYRRFTCMPGSPQGGSKVQRIVQIQGHILARHLLQGRAPCLHLAHPLRMRDYARRQLGHSMRCRTGLRLGHLGQCQAWIHRASILIRFQLPRPVPAGGGAARVDVPATLLPSARPWRHRPASRCRAPRWHHCCRAPCRRPKHR